MYEKYEKKWYNETKFSTFCRVVSVFRGFPQKARQKALGKVIYKKLLTMICGNLQ